MEELLKEIRSCTYCDKHLPLGPRPVLIASEEAELVIVGQAPGTKVHASGIPWDDQSGKLLREWMDIDSHTFYNHEKIAIVPMGFCYPGKGKTGDLPPRPECADLWQKKVYDKMPKAKFILLIGQYAQNHYLKDSKKKNLTETVRHFDEYLPTYLPLPHPSPRNRFWFKKNEWFNELIIPTLREKVLDILTDPS